MERTFVGLAVAAFLLARPVVAAEPKAPPVEAEMLIQLDLLKEVDLDKERGLLGQLRILERLRLLESLGLLESPFAPAQKEGR